MKQQKDLMQEFYLNRKQIARLLKISVPKARGIFTRADEIDSQMEYRPEENKVRLSTVLKVAGISYDELKKRAAL